MTCAHGRFSDMPNVQNERRCDKWLYRGCVNDTLSLLVWLAYLVAVMERATTITCSDAINLKAVLNREVLRR